jgi:hypothetical protein
MTGSTEREITPEEAAIAARDLIEQCYEQDWTDGLPIVPPIEQFVDEFLAQTDRDPDEVIMMQPHLDRECTIRQAAISAVMAGCKPEYFPVLLTAIETFDATGARSGLLQSTTGQAQIIIVNGPLRAELGFNSTHNIFGPGDRPNSTVGRALRLTIMNTLGIRPHEFDQSTHGTSAKYACCIAENEEESPWEPLHVERGFAPDASTVTVQMIRGDLYVEHRNTQVPEEILHTIADSMSYSGMVTELSEDRSFHGAVVVMGPEHAQILSNQGWSKQDVRQFLFEHFGRPRADLRRFGKLHPETAAGPDDELVPFCRDTESIVLVVAGANNAGVSTICPSLDRRDIGAEVGASSTREIVRTM